MESKGFLIVIHLHIAMIFGNYFLQNFLLFFALKVIIDIVPQRKSYRKTQVKPKNTSNLLKIGITALFP